MGVYANAGLLVDQVRGVLTRGEPMVAMGPVLMQGAIDALGRAERLMAAAEGTLERSDRVLVRADSMLALLERLATLQLVNVELEQRRMMLELERLERLAKG
jgi:hypothetical protein